MLEIGKYNNVSLNKINKGRLYMNHPNSWRIIKNLIKFQLICIKNNNDITGEKWLELATVIAINTIYHYTFIGQLKPDFQYIDYSKFNFYFWTSDKIKSIVDNIITELENGNNDIYNYKGEILMGTKKPTYFESLGIVQKKATVQMTKEWLIDMIGEETSYPKVIKKIKEETGYTRDQIRYAIKKAGLDKNLETRKYNRKSEEDTQTTFNVSITAVKEIKPETGIQIKSDIEDYNPFLSGPANSIIEEEKKSTFTDEDMELLDNLLNK